MLHPKYTVSYVVWIFVESKVKAGILLLLNITKPDTGLHTQHYLERLNQ